MRALSDVSPSSVADGPATLPALRIGMSGPRVVAWQTFLKGRGLDPGVIDGSFGEHTRQATMAFQTSAGLASDGVAGRETLLKAVSLGFELIEDSPALTSADGRPRSEKSAARNRASLFSNTTPLPTNRSLGKPRSVPAPPSPSPS